MSLPEGLALYGQLLRAHRRAQQKPRTPEDVIRYVDLALAWAKARRRFTPLELSWIEKEAA